MSIESVEAIALEAQRRGDLIGVRISIAEDDDIDPWMLPPSRTRADRQIPGPFPKHVQVVQSNLVYVEKNGLPSAMLNRLLRLAAFKNPEFYRAQAMRLPTFNKPRVITCGEDLANYIALPRGCIAEVAQLLETHQINMVFRDERFAGRAINVEFTDQLRPAQQDAAVIIAEHDQGILCAPTAFGKTALAAWMIAARKVSPCAGAPSAIARSMARKIGNVSQHSSQINRASWRGKSERTGLVDIAIIQSTHDKGGVKDLVAEFGQVIVDECHHLSAFTFEQVMKQVKATHWIRLRKPQAFPVCSSTICVAPPRATCAAPESPKA
jgi:hypothetical protein